MLIDRTSGSALTSIRSHTGLQPSPKVQFCYINKGKGEFTQLKAEYIENQTIKNKLLFRVVGMKGRTGSGQKFSKIISNEEKVNGYFETIGLKRSFVDNSDSDENEVDLSQSTDVGLKNKNNSNNENNGNNKRQKVQIGGASAKKVIPLYLRKFTV